MKFAVQKFDEILKIIIEEGYIRASILEEFGFIKEEIEELKQKGILKPYLFNLFTITDEEILYNYYLYLKINDRKKEAINCLNKLYELNPINPDVCFELFTIAIENKNYERAIQLLSYFYPTNNEFYNRDYLFIIKLLSFLTELPESYDLLIKHMSIEDIFVLEDDPRYPDNLIENEMRRSAFRCNDRVSSEILKTENKNLSLVQYVTLLLLEEITKQKQETKRVIEELLKGQKYEEILEYVENLRCMTLTNKKIITKMTKDLIAMSQYNFFFRITPLEDDELDIFSAIRKKCYKRAIDLYNECDDLSYINYFVTLLLSEIEKFLLQDLHEESLVLEKENSEEEVCQINNYSLIKEFSKNSFYLDELCAFLDLTEEETNIVKLYLAKDYYAIGDFRKGDKFLEFVYKSPHKNAEINDFFKRVKSRRKSYFQTQINE